MGDQDECEGIALLQVLEQVDNVGFGVPVEVACRFVGEQQSRRIDQCAGDHNPALLAAGHIAGVGIRTVGEADSGEEDIGSCVGLGAIHRATGECRDRNVVHCRQIRQQARELKDEADVAAAEIGQLRLGQTPDVRPIEPQFPSAGAGQRAEHREKGRFARTGPADDRDELARLQFETGAAHRLVSRSSTVSLGQRLRR